MNALILTIKYIISRPLQSVILWFFTTGVGLIFLLGMTIVEGPKGLKSNPFMALGISLTYGLVTMSIPYIFSGIIAPDAFQFRRDRNVSIEEAWDIFSECGLSLVLTSAITAIVIYLGSLLCAIPGLILLCMLAPAGPITTMEEASVREALNTAINRTQGHKIGIFLSYIVGGIIILVPTVIVLLMIEDTTRIMAATSSGQLTKMSMVGVLIMASLGGVFNCFQAIFCAMVYTETCGVNFDIEPMDDFYEDAHHKNAQHEDAQQTPMNH